MKILALIPPSQKTSPCRYYRGEGVLERLPGVDVDYIVENMEWSDWLRAAKTYKALYVMRSSHVEHLKIAQAAKDMGIPLWYDLDDDFFNVLPDSPAYQHFQRPLTLNTVEWFLAESDVVTVSTQQLVDRLGPKCKRIEHVPNGIEKSLIKWRPEREESISWRGGGSHIGDLIKYLPAMCQAARNTKHRLDIIGVNVFQINSMGVFPCLNNIYPGVVRHHDYINGYWDFMRFMRDSIRSKVHVVPLCDNLFNRAKSNISALEAIACGSVCLVPAWKDWEIPGTITYQGVESFESALQSIVKTKDETLTAMHAVAASYILDNLTVEKVNEKRIDILRSLENTI